MRAMWVGFLSLLLLLGWTAPAWSAQVASTEITTPQQFEAVKKKAFAASQAGQFDVAEDYWTQLLEAHPTSAPIWSNRGNIRVSQNRLEEAIADYDKSVELAPLSPDPYLNRGGAGGSRSLGGGDRRL